MTKVTGITEHNKTVHKIIPTTFVHINRFHYISGFQNTQLVHNYMCVCSMYLHTLIRRYFKHIQTRAYFSNTYLSHFTHKFTMTVTANEKNYTVSKDVFPQNILTQSISDTLYVSTMQ